MSGRWENWKGMKANLFQAMIFIFTFSTEEDNKPFHVPFLLKYEYM